MNLKSGDSLVFLGDWLPTEASHQLIPAGFSIANLECAVGTLGTSAPSKAYPVIVGPEVLSLVERSSISAVGLANNHVNDAGTNAFSEMEKRIRDMPNVDYYGTCKKPYLDLVLSNLKRVAVIGCLERCRSRMANLFPEEEVEGLVVELVRNGYSVVVTPHWGKESEYASSPTFRQRSLCRKWVDNGATAIVGHHPHVIHGIEKLKKSRCYYSIGNFAFNHAEGREHILTSFGIVVEWDLIGNSWYHYFVDSDGERVGAQSQKMLDAMLLFLSNDMKGSGFMRHVRQVGGVYLKKSNKSWRLRMKSRPVLTAAKYSVWSLLPSTLLFRLGALLGDSGFHEKVEMYVSDALSEETGRK